MSSLSRVCCAVVVILAVLAPAAPVVAADPGAPVSSVPPSVSGSATVGSTLTVDAGTWAPSPSTYAFTWLRDGQVIRTTASPRRVLTVHDLNHRISVRVRAGNAAGSSDPVTTDPTVVVRRGTFVFADKVRVRGKRRWDHRLLGTVPATTPTPTSIGYRWYRDGEPIAGATGRRYLLRVADFGHRIELRVVLRRAGYFPARRTSGKTAPIGHRVPVRRTFTYSIATRGTITADRGRFATLTAQSFADPRGWRAAGYAFRRVARGGDFTLYLAAASTLPSFGFPCSSMWSCRVGNNVIINQDRWQHASPAWNAQGLSLRDYRHMVLNHETGHWLGHRHESCPGRGRLAPVMMQQSKGLSGCRFNPFPLPGERWTSR